MNIQEILYTSSMAIIFGLGLFVYGMFLGKSKILRIIGISIMIIAITVNVTAGSFVIQTALQETQAQK